MLKDDTRGLGSKPTYSEGDNFGLGSFQDLLGRLNGKAEKEIEKSQQIRADLGLKHYVGQRYGASSFVRGGYLVGDRITDSKPTATKVSSVIEDHADVETTAIKRGTDRKKHKNHESTTDKAVVETKQERRERKAQRRSEKAERRLKKESKSKVGVDSEANSDAFDTDNTDSVESTSKMAIKEVSPMGWAVAGGLGGRQAVRQRFIRQKKMASMDPQALKEVRTLPLTPRVAPAPVPAPMASRLTLLGTQILMVKG